MTSTKEKNLEQEALKRKERLLNLKRKHSSKEGDAPNCAEDGTSMTRPIFRSYNPMDEKLKLEMLPKVKPIDLTEEISSQIDSLQETSLAPEIDLTTLAPRKQDWDLKRDLNKKLEKLERRTQRAIVELIRERLASGKTESLLMSVSSNAAYVEDTNLSDED